jgi:PTS system cellobiose-specific IIA component
MDEKLIEQSMELILCAGNGKSVAIDAIRNLLKDGDVEKAKEMVKEAGKEIGKAHEIQTSLLQNEMNGQNVEKSILLIHAQDHFMNALTIRDMSSLMIEMYEKLQKAEK